jgi:flagellar export protein FliJ
MKSFVFSLERLLRLRAQREREQAKVLGQAARDEAARREALADAVRRLDRFNTQVGSTGGVATAGTLRNLALTVAAAADQVEQAEGSHRDAEGALEVEQERFGAARRDRRVLERLREQRQATWSVEAARAEQQEIDEIARRVAHRGESS